MSLGGRVVAGFISELRPNVFTVAIHAKPGARVSSLGVLSWMAEAVEVKVAAPPVEGAANKELTDFAEETLTHVIRSVGSPATQEHFAQRCSALLQLQPLPQVKANTSTSNTSTPARGKRCAKKPHECSSGDTQQQKHTAPVGSAADLVAQCFDSIQGSKITSVRLARGGTSRNKLLEMSYTGSAVDLAVLWMLAAHDL